MALGSTNNTKQAVWVGIGSLCSFGFTIVSSMILSRYFDKAEYGTYKQVMYVYNTLLTIFTLGLPKAFSYFLPRVEDTQAKGLIRKVTNLFFLLGGLLSVTLYLFSPQIASFLKNPELKSALRIFAIVPFLLLPTMGLEGILATYKKTMFLAIYNILNNTFKLVCVAIPVVLWDLRYKEALIGFVIASALTFLTALYLKYYPVRKLPLQKCTVSYREIFKFSLPLLTASLWGIVIHSADQFFISRFFGRETFAEFSNGSFELPIIGMIITACATVLSPIFSRLNHEKVDPKEEIYPLWISVTEKSAKLIYPLLIYSCFFADSIMVALYGAKYETSSIYFQIKLSIDFLRIVSFAPLMINTGRVKAYSRTLMANAIVVPILEFVAINVIPSPYAVSVVSAVCRLAQILICLVIVARYFQVRIEKLFPWRTIGLILVPSALFLWAEHWVFRQITWSNQFLVIFLSFGIYALFFGIYAQVVGLNYYSLISPIVKDFQKKWNRHKA